MPGLLVLVAMELCAVTDALSSICASVVSLMRVRFADPALALSPAPVPLTASGRTDSLLVALTARPFAPDTFRLAPLPTNASDRSSSETMLSEPDTELLVPAESAPVMTSAFTWWSDSTRMSSPDVTCVFSSTTDCTLTTCDASWIAPP